MCLVTCSLSVMSSLLLEFAGSLSSVFLTACISWMCFSNSSLLVKVRLGSGQCLRKPKRDLFYKCLWFVFSALKCRPTHLTETNAHFALLQKHVILTNMSRPSVGPCVWFGCVCISCERNWRTFHTADTDAFSVAGGAERRRFIVIRFIRMQ